MYPPPPPPPPRRSGVSGPIVALIAVSCLCAGLLAGCVAGLGLGGNSGEPAAAAWPASASSSPSPSPTIEATTPKASASPTSTPSEASPTATLSKAAAKARVPNVVSHNHQAAQDELQAAGFYMLAEKDATGQGRMLLWDRNWVVVRQSPKPGTRVSTDTTITLYAKKIGE